MLLLPYTQKRDAQRWYIATVLSSGSCAYKLGTTLLEANFWSAIKAWSLVAGFDSALIQHTSQLEVKLGIFWQSWATADSKQAQWMQWISTNFRFCFWDKEPWGSDTFRLCLSNLFLLLTSEGAGVCPVVLLGLHWFGRIRGEQLWSRCLQLCESHSDCDS